MVSLCILIFEKAHQEVHHIFIFRCNEYCKKLCLPEVELSPDEQTEAMTRVIQGKGVPSAVPIAPPIDDQLTEQEEAWLPSGMWWEKWNNWKPGVKLESFDLQTFISNDIAGLLVFCKANLWFFRR